MILISGCGSRATSSQPEKDGSVVIATSFYPVYIFTLNEAKDIPNVKVVNMTQPSTGCLHDYAVTPDDMKNLEKARYLVINGAGMESFMDKVIKQFPDLKIIDSSKGINLIKGSGDAGDNPHIWVSISNAILQVQNIAEQLAALDPDHAVQYKSNCEAYVAQLKVQKDKMHKGLDVLANRNIVTFHEAFPYFAQEFDLNIAGVIEREPGSEPSAKEMDKTVTKIKALKVKAVFVEPQYPAKAAETIARETGCKVYTLDPVVTGPMKDTAYIDIMDKNLKTLQEALTW
jgi:zinc transport system substrate-binding protein